MLKEGDIIELKEGYTVYTDIPQHFAYQNCKGIFNKIAHPAIKIGTNFNGLDSTYLIGKYIVIKTAIDGEGHGHGPNDYYPPGHHVWCVNTDTPYIKVDFYENGSFTAKIEGLIPIGKAHCTWNLE